MADIRLQSQQLGNFAGYSDRLDYIFVRNGAVPIASQLIGALPPNNLNSDHAGIVSLLSIDSQITERSADIPEHAPFPISFWQWVAIALSVLVIGIEISMGFDRSIWKFWILAIINSNHEGHKVFTKFTKLCVSLCFLRVLSG